MIKIKTFNISMISFLLMFSAAQASNNPFTTKEYNEFTRKDQEKLENKLNVEIDNKLYSLERKLVNEIQSIKEYSKSNANTNTPNSINQNLNHTSDLVNLIKGGNNGLPVIGSVDDIPDNNKPSPIANKVKNAYFIGCIGEEVLFKNNKTKEQFFVTLEEAKYNEDFSKMGDCSF